MNIQLETNEVQFLLNVLGQLPTNTGAYPLLIKINALVQAAAQAEAPVEEPKAA